MYILFQFNNRDSEEEKEYGRVINIIFNSVKQIQRTNQRPKSKGFYLQEDELLETLQDAYESALRKAALEAFEGRYTADELGEFVNQDQMIQKAMDLILGEEH